MASLPSSPEPMPRSQPKVTVKAGVLCLHANLQRTDYGTFQQACEQLRQSNLKEVQFDLTRCTYATSSFIGDLVESVTQMKTDGKAVSVLVSPELGRLLQMAHLYHLFTFNIVDPRIDAH